MYTYCLLHLGVHYKAFVPIQPQQREELGCNCTVALTRARFFRAVLLINLIFDTEDVSKGLRIFHFEAGSIRDNTRTEIHPNNYLMQIEFVVVFILASMSADVATKSAPHEKLYDVSRDTHMHCIIKAMLMNTGICGGGVHFRFSSDKIMCIKSRTKWNIERIAYGTAARQAQPALSHRKYLCNSTTSCIVAHSHFKSCNSFFKVNFHWTATVLVVFKQHSVCGRI